MFIVSLAIADLIVGLIVMPLSATYIFTTDWLFGIAVCQIWIAIDYLASTASILNLFILSLDRYWSIMSPLKYIRKRTKKRALIMISFVWLLSSLWIIPVTGWHFFAHGGERTVPKDTCDTEYAKDSVFKVVTAFFNFYLPLIIMFFLYIKIFQEIRKRSKFELGQRTCGGMGMIQNQHQQHGQHLQQNSYIAVATNISAGEECELKVKDMHATTTLISPHSIQKNFNRTSRETSPISTTPKYLDTNVIGNQPQGIWRNNVNFKSSSNISFYERRMQEYVYDENVIDPLTEKVERYYYEKQPMLDYRQANVISNPTTLRETSFSTISSVSSAGTCDSSNKKQHRNYDTTNKGTTYNAETKQIVKRPALTSSYEDNTGKKGIFFSLGRIVRGKGSERKKFHRSASSPSIDIVKTNHFLNESSVDTVIMKKRASRGNQQQILHPDSDASDEITKDDNGRRLNIATANFKGRLKNLKSSSLTREIKAVRQLGVIMGAFTICFLPYFILFMVVAFCDGCIDSGLITAMTWIGYLNSTLNPVLYPLCNLNFRRKFRKMFRIEPRPRRDRCNLAQTINSPNIVRYD